MKKFNNNNLRSYLKDCFLDILETVVKEKTPLTLKNKLNDFYLALICKLKDKIEFIPDNVYTLDYYLNIISSLENMELNSKQLFFDDLNSNEIRDFVIDDIYYFLFEIVKK